MRSEAESKSIFISVVYDSLQFPRFSLRPPEPLWASKLGPISPLQFGVGLAVEKALSRVSVLGGLAQRGVESAARNRGAWEACSSEGPAALRGGL